MFGLGALVGSAGASFSASGAASASPASQGDDMIAALWRSRPSCLLPEQRLTLDAMYRVGLRRSDLVNLLSLPDCPTGAQQAGAQAAATAAAQAAAQAAAAAGAAAARRAAEQAAQSSAPPPLPTKGARRERIPVEAGEPTTVPGPVIVDEGPSLLPWIIGGAAVLGVGVIGYLAFRK